MNSYPWPSKQIIQLVGTIIFRAGATQGRHAKGSSKGGWFKGKEIDEAQPMSVKYAKKAYNNWNSRRVKLAKMKKRYKDSGSSNKELESKIKALSGEVDHFRNILNRRVARAGAEGYKINSRGDWVNKPTNKLPSFKKVDNNGEPRIGKLSNWHFMPDTSNASDADQRAAIKVMIKNSATDSTNPGYDYTDTEVESAFVLGDDGTISGTFRARMSPNAARNTAKALAANTGLEPSEVVSAIRAWARDSNGSVNSMSMQIAASEEFGVPLSSYQDGVRKDMVEGKKKRIINSGNVAPETLSINNELGLKREDERKLLRSMYDETQAAFAEVGVTEVTLYRGRGNSKRNLPDSGEIDIEQSTLASWTIDPSVASEFSGEEGRIVKVVVPVERILSCPSTGFGVMGEAEFVVIGSDEPETVDIYKLL